MRKTILMMATMMLFVACDGEKKNSSENEETVTVEEITEEVVATPVVTAEAGIAFIQELYNELYSNGKNIWDVEDYFGDALVAKLHEEDGGEVPLINYDPFINAQDYDKDSVMNSLVITELSEGQFQVEVEPLAGSKNILELTLGLDETGALKVLDIPSDPNISVLK